MSDDSEYFRFLTQNTFWVFPHCLFSSLPIPRPPLFIQAGHALAGPRGSQALLRSSHHPALRGHRRLPGLGLTAIACGPVAWANSHCLRVPPLALTQPGPAALTQPAPATGNRLRGSRRLISYHSFFEARLSSQISPLSK